MRGQVLFFDSTKNFGVVVAEVTEQEHFVSAYELKEHVDCGDWTVFDSEPNSLFGNKRRHWVAKNVRRIPCPQEYLLYGYVSAYFTNRNFGFITSNASVSGDLFFHGDDLLIVDGVQPVTVKDCRVSFCLAKRGSKTRAVQVHVEQWPFQDIENHFEQAPELAVDLPAPVVQPPSSVLDPQTKSLTLIEIMRLRKGKVLTHQTRS
jgi:cold shock CspA family protein